MKLFLTGDKGVGKTTLLLKLLKENRLPINGFMTRRLPIANSEDYGVYIAPASLNAFFDMTGVQQVAIVNPIALGHKDVKVFDHYGSTLLTSNKGCLTVMDELGSLESEAHQFCNRVFEVLNDHSPVLGVIKKRNTPFLDQVRTHKNVMIVEVTKFNRDQLYFELLKFVHSWNQCGISG